MTKDHEITDIKVPLKRPDRRTIYLEGKFAFSMSEGIFFQQNLQVGGFLTDKEIEELKKDDDRQKIREAAFRFLGYRPRSVKELRDRLRQKGWEIHEINPVLEELEGKGYLDDLEFARVFSRDKIKLKYLGPFGLRSELFQKGVEKKIIVQVLEETYTKTPPETVINALLQKKRVDVKKPIEAKEKTRLINLLKRKGFSWDAIEPVISKIKAKKKI